MAVTISPAEPADTRTLIQVNEQAFQWTYDLLFETPLSPETLDSITESRNKLHAKLAEESKNQTGPLPKQFFAFKAVDDETGEIVGEARWMIYYEDETLTKTIEEEQTERVTPPTPQMKVEANRAFQRLLSTVKREVLEVPGTRQTDAKESDLNAVTTLRKRVYLHVLMVHPNHQRKGIGRQLVQWGVDEADRLGLIAYLEASTDGRRLYEQAGYESVKELSMDTTPFGVAGELRFTVSYFPVLFIN
jgi:ribosomal protein S18 acetylase RimI-like enzyme